MSTAKGLNPEEISALVCVSQSTIRRYLTLFERTGDVQPISQRHGPAKLLGDFEQLVLLQLVSENPGIFLDELKACPH